MSYLDDITRDIVRFYAIFFTQGNKKKARRILEYQSSMDAMALAKAAFFFGCAMAIILLIVIENFKHPMKTSSLFVN